MSVPLANYTLTYSESSKGWPSFYSYHPEFIKGMNQYLYTFDAGNLYRHNVNNVRNNFYGTQYNTTIETIFNKEALENKVFKTIEIESSESWSVTASSDLQGTRVMNSTWFQKKEGDWFAFIRGLDNTTDVYNFNMRSAKGIGVPNTVTGTTPSQDIVFNLSLQTPIQVGDAVFSTANPTLITPTFVGSITAIVTTATPTTTLTVDTSSGTPALAGDFVFYVRNQEAESQGLLGHYCVMTLENNLTTATEMMAVKVDLMKSYP